MDGAIDLYRDRDNFSYLPRTPSRKENKMIVSVKYPGMDRAQAFVMEGTEAEIMSIVQQARADGAEAEIMTSHALTHVEAMTQLALFREYYGRYAGGRYYRQLPETA